MISVTERQESQVFSRGKRSIGHAYYDDHDTLPDFRIFRLLQERHASPRSERSPASGNTADYNSERGGEVIFHFFFEALRSDVFNFPRRARAPGKGPGRMQIVTGKLCAAVKLMSSRDRDLIARYIPRAPYTHTRAQFRERIYEVTNSPSFSFSCLAAKLNSTCPIS